MRKIAFTLAEVLITLSIIGVVAAFTVPSLMVNYQNMSSYSALKKQQSVLSNVYNLVIREHGHFDTWGLSSVANSKEITEVTDRFLPYLKYTKMCVNKSGCWASSKIKALNGKVTASWAQIGGIGDSYAVFQLEDGTILNLDTYDKNDMTNKMGVATQSNYTVAMYIDINGNKGPNTLGRDVFVFTLTERGLLPAGTDKVSYCNPKNTSSIAGLDCAAKVLSERTISY